MLTASLWAGTQRRSGSQRKLPEYFAAFRSHDTEGMLTRAVLKNGLTIVVEEHAHSPLSAIITLVKVGSFDEEAPRGLPQVYANLLSPTFCEGINPVGGVPSVSVSGFDTSFLSLVPSDELEESLEVHAGLLTNKPEYEAGNLSFAAEVGNWKEIRKRNLTQTAERSFIDWVLNLEKAESIKVPEKAVLEEFRETYYRPANIVISVSGSIRRERVLQKLVDLLGKEGTSSEPWEGSYRVELRKSSPNEFRYRQVRGETSEPLLFLGYPVPDFRQPGHTVARLLQYMVGEGLAALLRVPRAEDDRVPFGSRTIVRDTAAGGLFYVGLAPEADRLEQAEVQFLGLLEALESNGVPVPVLDRAKALLVTDFHASLEDLGYRARSLAVSEVLGDFRNRDKFPAEVAGISGQDVRRFIATYLSRQKLALQESLPSGFEARTFTSEALLDTLQILLGQEVKDEIGFLENLTAGEDYEAFKPVEFSPGFSEANLKKSSILRGPEILLRERHEVPLVHLGLFFPGGRITETAQTAGITELLLRAALHSRVRRDAGLSMTFLGALGSRILPVNEPDFFGIEVVLNSNVLDRAFMQFVQIFREAPPDAVDLEAAKKQILHSRTLEPGSWKSTLKGSVNRELFGDHPYGAEPPDWISNFENIDHATLMNWRQKHLDKVNPYIFVFGDVEGTSFLQSFVSLLSDSDYKTTRAVERKVPQPEDESFIKEARGEGSLILAFPGPRRGSMFVESLDVGMRILSGCRGQLAKSAGVGGEGLYDFRMWRETEVWGGTIFLELNGPDEKLQGAKEQIMKEIQGFSGEAVSERKFLNSLVGTITEFYLRQNDPSKFLADSMKEILANEPPDYGRRYVLNLKQLRAGEIESTLNRFMEEE
jgi:predicted Zn-dependent peptidase